MVLEELGVLACGRWLAPSGAVLMAVLDLVLVIVALGVLAAMGSAVRRLLPWASMAAALAVLLAVAALVALASLPLGWLGRLGLGALAASGVLAAAWAAGGPWRGTLRR